MKHFLVLFLLASTGLSQTRSRRADYALVLEDAPVAKKIQSRLAIQSQAAQTHLKKIRGAQAAVLSELAKRKVRVTATADLLVNAVFVRATPEEAASLEGMAG